MIDCIVPCYWIDERLIESNIKSWIKELPINRLIMGINNPDVYGVLSEMREKYNQIETFNQLEFKTLGACLVDLMNFVETEWFVYLHSDVQLTPYMFKIMKEYMAENVGIIESHREYWDGTFHKETYIPNTKASNYYWKDRSFSGCQLIQKKAIQSLIERIEDDYLYRNEDIIFCAECLKNGFIYEKTWAMHIHQTLNSQWSFDKEEAYEMQWKGIVKYTDPTEMTIKPCLAPFKWLKEHKCVRIYDVLKFIEITNPKWENILLKRWDEI